MTKAIRLPFDSSQIYVIPTTSNVFSAKAKIQIESGAGYSKENLTPDPTGSSRSPDPKKSRIQSMYTSVT